MSKNTGATKFRKVDVDQYTEDVYMEQEEQAGDGDTQGPNEGEVRSFLSQGKNTEALKCCLASAPLGTKNPQVKENALKLVTNVLLSFKQGEIEGAVKSLDTQSLDTLMKYIYKGFESPSEGSSAVLLTWHEKTFKIGGLGSIVRVLTDRKKV